MSNATITPEQAHAERIRRENARKSYVDFRHYMDPTYIDAPHNLAIAKELEAVFLFLETKGAQGVGRLIVEMPPQYGKTKDISRLFPSYAIGRLPDLRIGLASYGASLSDSNSAAIRNYVISERFSNLFGAKSAAVIDAPVDLSDTSASKSDWDLAEPNKGGCVSRGIGGGFSGKGVDLLIIDDPTPDIETARSKSHQEKLRDWYESVAVQRLSQGGAIIIIHTRWDSNDLIGQLLKKMGSDDPHAEQWKILYLPALALEEKEYPKTSAELKDFLIRGIFLPIGGDPLGRKPGEVLWPWKYSKEYVMKLQANLSPYVFAALHQQIPRAFSGGLFDEPDIKTYEPSILNPDWTWCCYVDLALGATKRSDWNVALPMTLAPESGDLIGRDMLRIQQLDRFLKFLKEAMLEPKNHKVIWGIEATAFQSMVWSDFIKDPTLAGVAIKKMVPTESKEDRAMRVSLRAKDGHFGFIRAPWNIEARRQLLEFPYGQHDDIVDSISGGQLMIAKFGVRREPNIR